MSQAAIVQTRSSPYGLRPGAEEFPLMVVLSIIYLCNLGCPNYPYTDGNSEIRDHTVAALQARGVASIVNSRAIHLLTYFRERFSFQSGTFPAAEKIGDQTISLPFYPTMSDEGVLTVTRALREILA